MKNPPVQVDGARRQGGRAWPAWRLDHHRMRVLIARMMPAPAIKFNSED
jgi:hypothetical protein